LGLGAFLLFTSLALSGNTTAYWNGSPCLSGKEYGFPLPFLYYMNRLTAMPPATHSSSVCTTSASIAPYRVNFSNALSDYLFWFAISLTIIFALNGFYSTRENKNREEERTTKEELPGPERAPAEIGV
ncbi:MAG TPA: hypothetical protein VED17_10885, partial [Nitrososphaerales archaeon]|nr:hypothetical protein [Nitrososphaerales archaeon]